LNPPATSPATSCDAFDPDAERAARHARLLQEMIELGMELMRDLRAPNDAAPKAAPLSPAETALAFERLSRAVRRTMLLERRFAEPPAAPKPETREAQDPKTLAAREFAEWRARFDAEFAALPPAERRRDVLRSIVPSMIETALEREPWREGENLYERCERVISDALADQEILDLPIPALMARICADLGVEPDWRQWDPGHWAGMTAHGLGPDDVAPKPAPDAAPPTARPQPPAPSPAPSPAPAPA
jgi:hypothetical protein